MCGILSLIYKTPLSEEQKTLLRQASEPLKLRGPDACCEYENKNSFSIFCRLSINDFSPAGNQPFLSQDEKQEPIALMCNGEIYNCKELAEEFSLKCNSTSDCEVILRLYEKLGFRETVKRLYGVFAIVLIHGNTMFLARDRFGVRPLFYSIWNNTFIVSSIPNCLANLGCVVIKSFEPGTTAKHNIPDVINKNTVLFTSTSFAYLKFSPFRYTNAEILKSALIKAVQIRLLTDRPIGCLLSGGLDSSLITSILCRLVGSNNVRTYSVGMKGSTDLHYARKVANYLGTVHKEVIFTPEDGFKLIPKIIETLASYDITTIRASVGMYIISKYISETTNDKVIFSGEGSDEVLSGYLYFHKAPNAKLGNEESLRLMRELHLYDVLRADRCISSNGLEPRVPFLDKNFVDFALALSDEAKAPQKNHDNGIVYEKYILRDAFRDGFLPDEVLWRRKEGFSDGVSSMKKSWYSHIQDYVEDIIPDYLFTKKFPSKEAMYYKMIFDNLFPTYDLKMNYWLPRWTDQKDPSGRLIMNSEEKEEPKQE